MVSITNTRGHVAIKVDIVVVDIVAFEILILLFFHVDIVPIDIIFEFPFSFTVNK